MKKVNDYNSIKIRDGNINDIFIFPDGSKNKMIFKSTDKIDNYNLIQIQLINIRKNGTDGKMTSWLKFRKFK